MRSESIIFLKPTAKVIQNVLKINYFTFVKKENKNLNKVQVKN